MNNEEEMNVDNQKKDEKEEYSRFDSEVAKKANERAKKEAKSRKELLDGFRNSIKEEAV